MQNEEVRALRESFGLTQAGFAGLLGMTPLTILRWEQGHTVPRGGALRLLQKVAAACEGLPPRVVAAALSLADDSGRDRLDLLETLLARGGADFLEWQARAERELLRSYLSTESIARIHHRTVYRVGAGAKRRWFINAGLARESARATRANQIDAPVHTERLLVAETGDHKHFVLLPENQLITQREKA